MWWQFNSVRPSMPFKKKEKTITKLVCDKQNSLPKKIDKNVYRFSAAIIARAIPRKPIIILSICATYINNRNRRTNRRKDGQTNKSIAWRTLFDLPTQHTYLTSDNRQRKRKDGRTEKHTCVFFGFVTDVIVITRLYTTRICLTVKQKHEPNKKTQGRLFCPWSFDRVFLSCVWVFAPAPMPFRFLCSRLTKAAIFCPSANGIMNVPVLCIEHVSTFITSFGLQPYSYLLHMSSF